MARLIFINYRRDDDPMFAGRLYENLKATYSSEQIFMDVDNIPAGKNFVRVLDEKVRACDVLLAIVGRNWLNARTDQGKRRIDSAKDFVRIEIEAALHANKQIIPVLGPGARMPSPEAVPASLRDFVLRNAITISHERFGADFQSLLKALTDAFAQAEADRLEAELEATRRDVATRREEEDRRADEVAKRATKERQSYRLTKAEIAKAEELANWDFVKGRQSVDEHRDHLERFPDGPTSRYCKVAMEKLVWSAMREDPDLEALQNYLTEFPDGAYAQKAAEILRALRRTEQEREDTRLLEAKEGEHREWAKTADAAEPYRSNPTESQSRTHAKQDERSEFDLGGGLRRRRFMIGASIATIAGGVGIWWFSSALQTDRGGGVQPSLGLGKFDLPASSVKVQNPGDLGGGVTMADVTTDAGKDFVARVLGSTERVWSSIFRQMGQQYPMPKLVLFSGFMQTTCGMAQSAIGPFYCPSDQKIYLDLAFYQDMKNKLGASGDFAEAYVIAHQVGHHVQNTLGIIPKVTQARMQMSETEGNALQVRVELQADCLAGIWAQKADASRKILEAGDIDEALNAAAALGNDRLQLLSKGYVVPESFTHGTSEQRVRWFKTGMQAKDIRDCDTFATDDL